MAKKKMTCVDLTTEMKNGEMKVLDSRKGTLIRMGNYAYTFIERGVKTVRKMWMCWVTVGRCLYGKVTLNADHVQVQFYIPHAAYERDVNRLADIIVEQAETLAEQVMNARVVELAGSLQAMKPIVIDEEDAAA